MYLGFSLLIGSVAFVVVLMSEVRSAKEDRQVPI